MYPVVVSKSLLWKRVQRKMYFLLKSFGRERNIGLYLLLSSYYKEKVKNQDGS